ncbi:uncharacterized protein FFE2_16056 [Fusarium fujikuroi]|nr:uncharacterized protein FFE2_16056 [Fusarium fujikuroi]
MAGYIVLID